MPTKRPAQSFKAAFERSLQSRTGVEVTNGDVRPAEMRRDLDRTYRLGGFSGDEPPGNEALQAIPAQKTEMSSDLDGPDGLLVLVERLGPNNQSLTSESFIKPFFKHLNLSQLNVTSLDADITKFANLTNLDMSRNSICDINFLSPKLKFLKIYNNQVAKITCAKQPSLSFLGAGYNSLDSSSTSQLVQRFQGLLSLDVGYNNLANFRDFLDDVKALSRLKHLCAAGNPLCLMPYYRLVTIKHLPELQLLDEQAVGEAEVADSLMVEHNHLIPPENLNLAISFTQVAFTKRLLLPLARELPSVKLGDDDVEIPVSEEERIDQVAQNGRLFFRLELPGSGRSAPLALRLELPSGTVGDDCCIDTTEVGIEEPPPEEPTDKKGKPPAKGAEEPPPKPPGEPIDLSGLKCVLAVPASAPNMPEDPKADGADGAETEPPVPPSEAPLFFPLPLVSAGDPDGSESLLQLRDWLRSGMRVKALYRKNKAPADPAAADPSPAAEGESEQPAAPEEEEKPRIIGGGVLSLSSALWPQISALSEEIRQEGKLPALPPTFSIGPSTLTLAPYANWLEPSIQVPDAAAAKSLSDVSASVTMDVLLYAKEPQPVDDDAGA